MSVLKHMCICLYEFKSLHIVILPMSNLWNIDRIGAKFTNVCTKACCKLNGNFKIRTLKNQNSESYTPNISVELSSQMVMAMKGTGG